MLTRVATTRPYTEPEKSYFFREVLMLYSNKLLDKYSKLFIHLAANINNSLVIDIFLYSHLIRSLQRVPQSYTSCQKFRHLCITSPSSFRDRVCYICELNVHWRPFWKVAQFNGFLVVNGIIMAGESHRWQCTALVRDLLNQMPSTAGCTGGCDEIRTTGICATPTVNVSVLYKIHLNNFHMVDTRQ
jgi:hypothetical protein